jgi:hypothetical protein
MSCFANTFEVTNGLVLSIDSANIKSYSGSGTICIDLSSNGNNGTLVNNVIYTASSGGSFTFNGSNNRIDFGNVLNVGTNDMTIISWFNTPSPSTTGVLVSKALAGSQNYRFDTNITSSKFGAFIQGNGGVDITPFATTTLIANTWYMGAAVYSRSSSISLYLNGVLQTLSGSSTISQWNGLNFQSSNPFRIGSYTAGDNVSASSVFNGSISLTQIYNRALSSDEIVQNFNAIRSRYGI